MPYNYSLITNWFPPQGKTTIDLTVINSPNNYNTIYPRLINMGAWEIGLKDENNDLFQYPSGFSFDIMLTNVTDEQFINIVIDLQTIETRCYVTKNLSYIFIGYVYNKEKSLTVDYRKKIISFKVVDQFVDLKAYDPRTNPFGFILNDYVKINDLIYNLLTLSSPLSIVSEVVNLCPYEAKNGSTYYPVSQWGLKYDFYFGPSAIYGTILEVVKSILNALGCKGYIGFDGKFYIVPRYYYQGLPVKTIPDENVSEKIEIDVIRRMKGIQIFLNTGSPGVYVETSRGVVEKNGTSLIYPDLVEVMYFDQPVGTIPGGGVSNLFVTDGVNWGVAEENHVRRKQANGTYTADKSLWTLTADDAWALNQKDRPLFKYKVYPTNVNGYNSLLSYLTMGDFFNRSLLTSRITHSRYLGYNWNDCCIDVDCIE